MQLSRPRPGHLRPRTRPLKFGLEAKAWPWGLHHWHVMRLCSWDFIWEITKCLTQVTSLMLAHRTTVWRRSWAVQRYGTLTVRSVLCYQDEGGQRRVRRRNQHPCRQLLRDLTWLCVPMKNSSLAWQWLVRISPSSSSSSSFVLNQAAWPINIKHIYNTILSYYFYATTWHHQARLAGGVMFSACPFVRKSKKGKGSGFI